jgi:hypothetical protein
MKKKTKRAAGAVDRRTFRPEVVEKYKAAMLANPIEFPVIAAKPALGKPVELGDLLPKGYQTASSEVGRLMPENIAEFRTYQNLSEVERRLLAHIFATEKDDAGDGGEWVRVLCIKDCLAMAPGTPVLVLADDLRIVATRTTRKPRDFGGQPVVDLEGFEHPYAMRLVYVRGRFARTIEKG